MGIQMQKGKQFYEILVEGKTGFKKKKREPKRKLGRRKYMNGSGSESVKNGKILNKIKPKQKNKRNLRNVPVKNGDESRVSMPQRRRICSLA